MKKSKTFRLSEDVCELLDRVPNATALVEELIRNGAPEKTTPPWKNIEYKIDQLEKLLLEKIDALSLANARSDDPLDEYACCSSQTPCKHWSYNAVDEVWTNSITGNTRVING